MTQVRYSSRLARLIANTTEDDEGCWIWQGRLNRSGGYPIFSERVEGYKNHVATYAHRAVLEEWLGYFFPHDEAGHSRCYKTACINPECLEIQTSAHNLAERRGYAVKTINASWIPVLYPTPAREEAERIEAFLDKVFFGPKVRGRKTCPF